mgnify:FL=1
MCMRFNFFAAFVGIIFVLPLSVMAQSIGNSVGGTPFTVSVSPQYPTPYSQASISLISPSLDLANAIMAVSVAGKEIYRGSVQPVAIPVGKTGSVANVKVTISSDGVKYSQTVFIQPQDLVLVAEPISSAPPFYRGTPLIPLGGSVRVVAVASLKDARGKAPDPSTLSYSWTVDNSQIANSSGIGKTAIMVASPLQYRSRSVSVVVTSQDGSLGSGASLSLTAQEPIVRIYQNDPLLGIRFDHALSGQYAIADVETALYAAPFSLPTTSGTPFIQWFLNGSSAQTGNTITLRPAGSGQGGASLSLVASAGNSTKATANLSLSFGAKSGFNLFSP